MAGRFYVWRKLTPEERRELLAERKRRRHPWHRPPHFDAEHPRDYHLTAACYEHTPHIGQSPERLDEFTEKLLRLCDDELEILHAWCVLPNHYHLLVRTDSVRKVSKSLGKLHGRCSYEWNLAEAARGRRVFQGSADRAMRSERHFWATLNYVHHNPVRHGYVEKWTDWPWSSAADFLEEVGRTEAERVWNSYPLLDYGEEWDDPNL
jgi:putative transposase